MNQCESDRWCKRLCLKVTVAIVCYLHPPLQLGWCAVSDPEHRCIFWPGGCCHPHGPPCRLQGRDGGGSGCSALAGPTAHPLGEYFFQHFFFQLGLTWYKQSFSIRDAPFLYSSFICSARNLEIIIKTIPTHSVSPRRSRCILRYVPFFFSCSEITLNLTVQLGENEILTLSLAVYVPSEEVSIPASVQQQSWWKHLLQTPVHETGPHPVSDNGTAHPVCVLVQRAARGKHPILLPLHI